MAIFGLPHPKSKSNFFVEITKGDHKLLKALYFIKTSAYVYAEFTECLSILLEMSFFCKNGSGGPFHSGFQLKRLTVLAR